jgi:cell division septum initiation protein DivIVA
MENHYDIESIRKATFREARRGWDRREVENFLDGIAEWLEGGGSDEVASHAVQKKLERAGQTTARILSTAEQEAETLRVEAQEEARRTVEDARTNAAKTTETAGAKAKRTIEEGERRRNAIETVIQDLVARRDAVIAEIDRLARDLRAATDSYRTAPFEDGSGKGAAAPDGDSKRSRTGRSPAEDQVKA